MRSDAVIGIMNNAHCPVSNFYLQAVELGQSHRQTQTEACQAAGRLLPPQGQGLHVVCQDYMWLSGLHSAVMITCGCQDYIQLSGLHVAVSTTFSCQDYM